jgi:hypothetical protein
MPVRVNDLIWPDRKGQILFSTSMPCFKVPMRRADSIASVAHDPFNLVATRAEIEATGHHHLSFASQGYYGDREAMRDVGWVFDLWCWHDAHRHLQPTSSVRHYMDGNSDMVLGMKAEIES